MAGIPATIGRAFLYSRSPAMSQNYPPPGGYPVDPLSYNYGAPVANVRPTSVTTLAIIGIVLASLGLLLQLCGGVGLAAAVMTDVARTTVISTGTTRQTIVQPKPSGAFIGASLLMVVVYLALNIAVLAAAIGMLKLLPWSRKLMVRVSIAQLIAAAIWLVIQFAIVFPETKTNMNQTINQMGNAGPLPSNFGSIMGGAVVGFNVLWAAFSVILPVLNVVILRKQNIKTAFGEHVA